MILACSTLLNIFSIILNEEKYKDQDKDMHFQVIPNFDTNLIEFSITSNNFVSCTLDLVSEYILVRPFCLDQQNTLKLSQMCRYFIKHFIEFSDDSTEFVNINLISKTPELLSVNFFARNCVEFIFYPPILFNRTFTCSAGDLLKMIDICSYQEDSEIIIELHKDLVISSTTTKISLALNNQDQSIKLKRIVLDKKNYLFAIYYLKLLQLKNINVYLDPTLPFVIECEQFKIYIEHI